MSERACAACGAGTIDRADFVCKGGDACEARSIWPDKCCVECGEVICVCGCDWCGGDGDVENDDFLEDDREFVPCPSCNGSGLKRKMTLW